MKNLINTAMRHAVMAVATVLLGLTTGYLFAAGSRRLISQLAGRINTLLVEDDVTRCSLVVGRAIHKQLLEALDPKARAKIVQSLASNLTKTDPQALAGHFVRTAA